MVENSSWQAQGLIQEKRGKGGVETKRFEEKGEKRGMQREGKGRREEAETEIDIRENEGGEGLRQNPSYCLSLHVETIEDWGKFITEVILNFSQFGGEELLIYSQTRDILQIHHMLMWMIWERLVHTMKLFRF